MPTTGLSTGPGSGGPKVNRFDKAPGRGSHATCPMGHPFWTDKQPQLKTLTFLVVLISAKSQTEQEITQIFFLFG